MLWEEPQGRRQRTGGGASAPPTRSVWGLPVPVCAVSYTGLRFLRCVQQDTSPKTVLSGGEKQVCPIYVCVCVYVGVCVYIYISVYLYVGFPSGSVVKNLPANADVAGDPWVRKIPWRRKCNPLQYSCLGNPMDRGTWQATVRGGSQKSQTQLSY